MSKKNKNNSPYTAAITGGGFLFEETNLLLPLLQSENRIALLKEEMINNHILQINSEKSRQRTITEVARRFDTMPISFWQDYIDMEENERKIALLFVILKTYKICFDFHIRVTMRKWNGIAKSITHEDLMIELSEIAAKDEFVDSWSENTMRKVASTYLSILRKVGMLDNDSELHSVEANNMDYYIKIGESWFLEACLLQPYQIDRIKQMMI
ncbi:MAG: BrxA family protein [Candidatus Aphodosoma sp.]